MPDYRFRDGRYYTAAGRVVPERVLARGLDAVIASGKARLRDLSRQFAGGQLDVLAWRTAARAELRTVYGAAALLAVGGQEGMDASARGWLGGQLRQQYTYLDQFALQVSTGQRDPAAPQTASRLDQYAQGAWATYQAGRQRGAELRGATRERNVLDTAAVHCGDCETETGKGWVPIGTLTPPGGRACRSNCRCHLEFDVVPAATLAG